MRTDESGCVTDRLDVARGSLEADGHVTQSPAARVGPADLRRAELRGVGQHGLQEGRGLLPLAEQRPERPGHLVRARGGQQRGDPAVELGRDFRPDQFLEVWPDRAPGLDDPVVDRHCTPNVSPASVVPE